MGFRNPILGGGGALVRPAIKSPNYAAGVAGWIINRSGDAEFNDLSVRGTFQGLNYVVSEAGIFFYNGTPAAGTLAGSWAPMDGTDPYGNAYTAGLTLYSDVGQVFLGGLDGVITSTGSSGAVISVEDGQLAMTASPTDEAPALILQNLVAVHGSLSLLSGADTADAGPVSLDLVTAAATPTTGNQDTYPRTSTSAQGGGLAHHYVTGALVKAQSDGQTAYTWQTPAFSSGWAGGSLASSRYQALQVRLDGMDNIHVSGVAHATAALAAGSYTIATSPYLPRKLQPGVGLHMSSADAIKATCRVAVDSTGAIGIATPSAIASGDAFYFHPFVVPMGGLK